jgi:ligand-binding sensor domain-containing protein
VSFRRASRHGSRRWLPLLLGLAPVAAQAELPVGWSVHTFTGRIHEIEPAGGVLACATDGGLLFFDPQTQQFAPPIADAGCTDGDCLSSNRLTCVSRDAEGSYWLGTEASGVVVFRPASTGRQFGRFFEVNASPGGGLLADSVRCIEAYRARTVYVGTSRGVAQIELLAGSASYNPDASRRLGSDLEGTIVNDLAVDSLFVWVATDSGMSRYGRNPPYAVEFLPDSLVGPGALSVEILAGTVYAGTTVGVFQWQESAGAWQRVRAPSTPPDFPARSIARLPNGWMFVGSDRDVELFTGFFWGPLSPSGIYLLSDRRFTSVVATGDTVWTCQHNDAGEGGYLERWTTGPTSAGTWTRFEPNAIPPSAIQKMSLGPNGDLWIGTRLAGVARLRPDRTWCIWNGNDPDVRNNMSDDEGHVSALLVARDGKTWFTALPQPGNSAPVDMLAPSSSCDHAAEAWTHIQPGQSNFGGRYWRFEQDGEGNVFLLADGDADGVPAIEDGGMEIVSPTLDSVTNLRAGALGGSSIGALAFETTARPWGLAYLGINNLTNQGLKQWTRSGQLLPPDPPPSSNNFITLPLPSARNVVGYRDIVVTPGNARRLWVGTESDIFEYDADARSLVTEIGARRDARPGLLSGDIKDLQFDDFGNLWVATVKGLNRLRLAERAPGQGVSIDAFTTIETIRELNAASTVGQLYDPVKTLAPLPSPLVNALSYDHDRDLLYIGTAAGLAILDVQAFSRQPVIPVEQAVLYPNPVRIDAGHEEVRIANISEPATVTIYTIEGQVVCEVSEREDGDVVWTLSTPSCLQGEGNFQIASGIYPVRITTSTGSTMRTIVVIR